MDAAKEKALVTEDDVSGLPALVVYRSGKRLLFTGQHTRRAVMMYITKLLAPPYDTVADKDALLAVVSSRAAKFDRQPFVTVCQLLVRL